MFKNLALIVASGSSLRFANSEHGKIYQEVNGLSVLYLVLKKFTEHPLIDAVCLVVNHNHSGYYESIIANFKLLGLVFGGETRKESVKNGLDFIAQYNPKNVLIHDAARPFVSNNLIRNVVEALELSEAVDVLLPVTDTLKCLKEDLITIVPRDHLYQTQTPQGFRFSLIHKLHKSNTQNATDDISLCLENNIHVSYTRGEAGNYKITFKEDIEDVRN